MTRPQRDWLFVAVLTLALTGLFWWASRPTGVELNVITSGATFTEVGKALGTTYGPKKYSMGAEEWILRELLQDRRTGVFVDVGAGDARAFSNTFYLESALGWSGVAIDAQKEYAGDYARYRPQTRFRSFFVSDRSYTTLPFYVPTQRASASADPKWAERQKLGAVTIRTVFTVTLDDLLASERITRFDLLSMDIEGHEPQALAGFSIDRFKP